MREIIKWVTSSSSCEDDEVADKGARDQHANLHLRVEGHGVDRDAGARQRLGNYKKLITFLFNPKIVMNNFILEPQNFGNVQLF